MGDINFDLTTSKRFLFIPYSLGAIGAVTGAIVTTATALPGIATAAAIGLVVGGIGVPVAAVVAAVGVYGVFIAVKSLLNTAIKEGAMLPLGVVVVGVSCTKALFYTPIQAGIKGLKSLFNKKATPSAPARAPQPKADDSSPKL